MNDTLLQRVTHVLGTAQLKALHLEAQERLEQAGGPLWLYVLGPGNAGKSSLINAIAGAPIAPVGVVPITWKIDIFRRATDGEKATIRTTDGRRKDVTIAQARLLCEDAEEAGKEARKRGETVESNLAEVTWWVDAPGLPEHLALVDTPGLSQMRSLDAGKGGLGVSVRTRERALTLLHRADVLVWLMRANKLQSTQHDELLDALQEQGKSTRRVVGVLSRWDAVGEDRRSEALSIARTRFGVLVPEFLPAVLKAGKEGYEESVDGLRTALVPAPELWRALKTSADDAFAKEQARRGVRTASALSLAQAKGVETVRAKTREAQSWLGGRLDEARRGLHRKADALAKTARSRCRPVAREFEEWDAANAASTFHTRVLDVDLADAELRETLEGELPAVTAGLADLGMRIELPVLREVDRQGRGTTSVHALGAFVLQSSQWARDQRAWRSKVMSAKGFLDGIADVFRSPQDKARLRFERGIDAWLVARKKDIDAVVEAARGQLTSAFEARLEQAHAAAYGRAVAEAPREILKWGQHAHRLEQTTGVGGDSERGLQTLYRCWPEALLLAQRRMAVQLVQRIRGAQLLPGSDGRGAIKVASVAKVVLLPADLPREEGDLKKAMAAQFQALRAPLTASVDSLKELEATTARHAARSVDSVISTNPPHLWGPSCGWFDSSVPPRLDANRVAGVLSPTFSMTYSGPSADALLQAWHEAKGGPAFMVLLTASLIGSASACSGFVPGVGIAVLGGAVALYVTREEAFRTHVLVPLSSALDFSVNRCGRDLWERANQLPQRTRTAVVDEACRSLNRRLGLSLFSKDL